MNIFMKNKILFNVDFKTSMLMPLDVRAILIAHLKISHSISAGIILKYFSSKSEQSYVKTGMKMRVFMS